MQDPYGIPDNMFGPVPEEFFAVLGRVVMVAAMLELQILDLLTVLEHATQDKHAGRPVGQLLEECRTRLGKSEAELCDPAMLVLNRAAVALETRNEVVHSLWPSPSLVAAYGWRPVIKKKRSQPDQPNASIATSVPELGALIERIVALVEEVAEVSARAMTTPPLSTE